MGYLLIYVTGFIVSIIVAAYVSVKINIDIAKDSEYLPIFIFSVIFWFISLPAFIIILVSSKIWKYSIIFFNKVVKNKIK